MTRENGTVIIVAAYETAAESEYSLVVLLESLKPKMGVEI